MSGGISCEIFNPYLLESFLYILRKIGERKSKWAVFKVSIADEIHIGLKEL